MKQPEDIKVLNIDDTPYAVDAMSDEVQEMVAVFNSWNRKEAEAFDSLTMIRAAKNDLSRTIVNLVRKEKEEAEAAKAAAAEPAPASETGGGPAE